MPTATGNASATNNQFETQFDCFVINLKRQPERLKEFIERNKLSGVNFHHSEAIDGTKINPANCFGRIVAQGAVGYSSSIIGCAMSHLELWHRCADQTKDFVVFEDDAVVRNDIKTQLNSLVRQVPDWDIFLLGYNMDVPLELNIAPGIDYNGTFSVGHPTSDHLADFTNSTGPVALLRLNMALGTCGYTVTPKGAQFLISACFPMDNRQVRYHSVNHEFKAYGIDCMMATIYPKILAFACVGPLVMTPNDPETSTVQRV
jgi:glycosyl transferase, family 25